MVMIRSVSARYKFATSEGLLLKQIIEYFLKIFNLENIFFLYIFLFASLNL